MRITIDNEKRRLDQWDTGQRLILEGIPAGVHVDFARPGTEPLGRETYEQDGSIYVNVPDAILQDAGAFGVWFYVRDGQRGETVRFWPGTALPRPKPGGYIHSDEELKAWEQLQNQIDLRHQCGYGKPSTDTPGAVGGFYTDLDSGDVYKCIAADDGKYQWSGLIEKNYVIYNAAQNIPEHQRMRARINIGAASAADLEALKNAASGFAVQADAPENKRLLWVDPDDDAGGSSSGFAVQADAPDDKSVLWVDPDDVAGSDGTNGKSAYEYAREAGYTGSEEEFAQKLAEDAPTAFYITVTGDAENGYTVDKSKEELLAAHEAGCPLYAVYPDNDKRILPLSSCSDGWFAFAYTFLVGTYILMLNTNGDGVSVEQCEIVAATAEMVGALPAGFVSGATVGQVARITAVDDNGVPTSWEAVEMAGGDETLELIVDLTTTEEVDSIQISKDSDGNSFSVRDAEFLVNIPVAAAKDDVVFNFTFSSVGGARLTTSMAATTYITTHGKLFSTKVLTLEKNTPCVLYASNSVGYWALGNTACTAADKFFVKPVTSGNKLPVGTRVRLWGVRV